MNLCFSLLSIPSKIRIQSYSSKADEIHYITQFQQHNQRLQLKQLLNKDVY